MIKSLSQLAGIPTNPPLKDSFSSLIEFGAATGVLVVPPSTCRSSIHGDYARGAFEWRLLVFTLPNWRVPIDSLSRLAPRCVVCVGLMCYNHSYWFKQKSLDRRGAGVGQILDYFISGLNT